MNYENFETQVAPILVALELFYCVHQPCFASVREIMFCAASSAK